MDSEEDWPGSGPEADEEEEGEEGPARPRRRFSLGAVGKSLGRFADNIARSAAAASELLVDSELRSRSAALISEVAAKAGANVAKGGGRFCLGAGGYVAYGGIAAAQACTRLVSACDQVPA